MINKISIKKLVVLSVIIFIILFVYSFFNGPPFGGILAESKILDYTSAMYGNTQVITRATYNSKDGYYSAEVSDENGQNIKEIKYKPFDNVLIDNILQERISIQFNSDFAVVKGAVPDTIQIPTKGRISPGIYTTGGHKGMFLLCLMPFYNVKAYPSQAR